jgi:hypothetical protein
MTSVIDRGGGIDESEQLLVFEKCHRGKNIATMSKGLEWDCLLRAQLSKRLSIRADGHPDNKVKSSRRQRLSAPPPPSAAGLLFVAGLLA